MNTAPGSPNDHEVLELVQQEWSTGADRASYLPVGIGAHHWRIDAMGAPILFATLDVPSERRSADEFELAYASAEHLASTGFRGVVAPIQRANGMFTVPLAHGLLSVTSWLNGRSPSPSSARDPDHVVQVVVLLQCLHQGDMSVTLPRWRPRVPMDLHESLRERLLIPWNKGPFGEPARQMITDAMEVLRDSLREYNVLGGIAMDSQHRWVPTHGEPHWANQFLVGDDLVFIDWETISLAPPEIDMTDLPLSARRELGADEDMIRMFRLEWQLSEIAEYANWFEREHFDSDDDRFALEKLENELRPV